MRRPRYRVVDPTTSVSLADGPLTTAGSCMRWESQEQVIANVVIVVLAVAIFAVWVVQIDAPALRVRTGVNGGVAEQRSRGRRAERRSNRGPRREGVRPAASRRRLQERTRIERHFERGRVSRIAASAGRTCSSAAPTRPARHCAPAWSRAALLGPGRRGVRRRPGRVRTHMVSGQIVAIVVLLVLVLGGALAWWLFRRNNTAQRQIDATRHREEAASRTASADRLEAEAAERAARAQREQAQAEELAEMARRDRELAQSQIAKADRLDPDGSRPVEATPVEPPAPDHLRHRERAGHGEVEVTVRPPSRG